MKRYRDCIASALCMLLALSVIAYYDVGASLSSGIEETATNLNVGAVSYEYGYFRFLPLLSIALAVLSVYLMVRCLRKKRLP
jgi:hypothetical protein